MLFADRENGGEADANVHGLWPTLGWFAFLLVLTSLIGFIVALAIILVAFLKMRVSLNWLNTVLYAVAGIFFMCFMAWTFNRDFPPGALQSYVNLPWPLTCVLPKNAKGMIE